MYSYSYRKNYYSTYTIYYSKTILHVHMISELSRINLAPHFAAFSDCVSKKILGDHPLTINIVVLSNPAVKAISVLPFYFLDYLVVITSSALLSSLVSTFLM